MIPQQSHKEKVKHPKCNDWVQVFYEYEWTPFLVYQSTYEEGETVYVHGWLFRPGHNGSQWRGDSDTLDGGIPAYDPGDLGELHWRWPK